MNPVFNPSPYPLPKRTSTNELTPEQQGVIEAHKREQQRAALKTAMKSTYQTEIQLIQQTITKEIDSLCQEGMQAMTTIQSTVAESGEGLAVDNLEQAASFMKQVGIEDALSQASRSIACDTTVPIPYVSPIPIL